MKLAKSFYEDFKREHKKSPLPGGTRKWAFWTKANLKFLERLGEKKGYNVMKEKPTRIDMTWFDPKHLEPEVAIEYETNEKSVLESEVRNLACSNARLKVLITYAEEGNRQDMLQKIKGKWTMRSKRTWNDEFLVMFIVFHREKGYRVFDYFEGHIIYPLRGNLRIKDLESFPIYL